MSRNKLRIGVIGVGYVASNNFLPVFCPMITSGRISV